MALKGKSFSINSSMVDKVVENWKKENKNIDDNLARRVGAAMKLVYNLAHAKRPMTNVTTIRTGGSGKMGSFSYAKKKTPGSRKVSDPSAKYGVPVAYDNGGTLRASIKMDLKKEVGRAKGRVFTDNPYAGFLEFGTSKMEARPFMQPALMENQENIKKIFKDFIK